MSILLQVVIGLVLTSIGVITIVYEEKLINFEDKIARYAKLISKNVSLFIKERKQQPEKSISVGYKNEEYDEILAELDEYKKRPVQQEKVLSLKDYFVA